MNIRFTLPAMLLAIALPACGDDDGTTDDTAVDMTVPVDGDTPTEEVAYAFESRFEPGVSSVSYTGQTLRHVLIDDMKSFIGELSALVDGPTGNFDEPSEVLGALTFYYEFDESGLEEPIRLTTTPPTAATTYGDIAGAKSLVDKIAGKDGRDHEDFDGGAFAGWNDTAFGGTESPDAYVRALFQALADNAFARAEDMQPTGPDGEELPVYVTGDGLDLQQLIQKFLLMAVTFSQGTDDYLDEGIEGANTRSEGDPYTGMEHAWDESFGYFGAARNYDEYTDEEIASKGGRDDWQGHHDTDGNGTIELTSEYNFGASTNAAKRDLGATTDVDYTSEAFDAYVAGRAVLAGAGDDLSDADRAALEMHRDAAVLAWEKAIAATVVHYINDTLADMDAKEAADGYSYLDHAKHWSELKGFALGLQFNPRSPLSSADFVSFHDLVGDRPALDVADFESYRTDLLAARDILEAAYGFDSADVEGW